MRVQPMTSSAVVSNVAHPSKELAGTAEQERSKQAPLVAAGVLLAKRGVLGLIWVNERLVVTSRYGELTDFVEVGARLTSSVPPFVGLEKDIQDLKSGGSALLDLPIVSIVRGPGAAPKLNFTALWSLEENCYLVLVSRAGEQTNVEVELSRQIRARLIAEAEVTYKSAALTKANAELARANCDLEEFASIISHDLKGPMRALRYMTDDLAQEASVKDTPDVLTQIARMRAQSQRMSEMLTSLLDYSSAGRKDEVIEQVDMAALVQSIVQSTPRPVGIELHVSGDWPVLETLRAPLDLVLRNLIDNAIKHHDRPKGVVWVRCKAAVRGLRFEIDDDGPGINPMHHASVFLPFRRLNLAPADANPGSHDHQSQGMGLAFVKRWVEAAGGQIGLTSAAPDKRGTLFWFEWPHKAPE